MFSKKILSGLLAATMMFSLCVPISAAELTSTTNQDVVVTYGMNESFVVSIPSNLPIDSTGKATATVSASNVMIASGSTLDVSVSGDDYVDSWELVDAEEASNTLTYTIGTSEEADDIVSGSTVLSVAAGEAYDSIISEVLHFTVIDELAKSGEYSDTLTFTVSVNGDSSSGNGNSDSDKLSDPIYYTSLAAALGDTTQTGDADVDTAAINVYVNTESGRRTIELQENIALAETLLVEEDITLDLNGNEITTTVSPAIRTTGTDVVIDGTTEGSGVTVTAAEGDGATVLSVKSGELTVNGGTYTSNITNAGSLSSYKYGVYTYAGTTLNLNDATVIATESGEGFINAIHAKGDLVISDSTIIGKANYVANAAGTNYGSVSRGIYSEGSLELYNSYVWGAHSGVLSKGTVYVDGGVYEGYGHGGFYLSGSDTTNYFYNCQINWAPMMDGTTADSVAGTNGAALYVGGSSVNNVKAYFDNCDFNMNEANGTVVDGSVKPFYGIVLRTSSGESNNTVYLSNCFVGMADYQMFRGVGTSSHTVYNGVGNDWSNAAAVHKGDADYYIDTTDSYAK